MLNLYKSEKKKDFAEADIDKAVISFHKFAVKTVTL